MEDPINRPSYYTELLNIKLSELGIDISSFEDIAQDILEGCADWCLRYTGLDIQKERRDDIDGNGQDRLLVKHYPAQKLIEVSIKERLTQWVDITQFCTLYEDGQLILDESTFYWAFPEGTKNVRVRYVAGLTRIPPMLRMTIIELTQAILLKYTMMGALMIQDNPLIDEAIEAAASGSSSSSSSGGVDATASTEEATKRIKSVAIKSLQVTFTDDIRSTADMMRDPVLRRSAYLKILDDILSEKSSLLKRLDMIAKVYVNSG